MRRNSERLQLFWADFLGISKEKRLPLKTCQLFKISPVRRTSPPGGMGDFPLSKFFPRTGLLVDGNQKLARREWTENETKDKCIGWVRSTSGITAAGFGTPVMLVQRRDHGTGGGVPFWHLKWDENLINFIMIKHIKNIMVIDWLNFFLKSALLSRVAIFVAFSLFSIFFLPSIYFKIPKFLHFLNKKFKIKLFLSDQIFILFLLFGYCLINKI